MVFREIAAEDVPALFAVRVATHESALSREELTAPGITEDSVKGRLTADVDTTLRAYAFYRSHGWEDDRIENGMRYMAKTVR